MERGTTLAELREEAGTREEKRMANRELSIGCVLIMGGALTNCGGTVGTRSDGGDEQGGAAGSGFVGVPPNGGFTGAVGTQVGAGSGPYGGSTGVGGYVGT